MPSIMGAATKVAKVTNAVESAFGPAAKAKLEFCNEDGKAIRTMQCGFNPTEYSVSRSMRYRRSNGFGKSFRTKNLQAGKGECATLSVTIFVDEKSNLDSTILQVGVKAYNAVKYQGFTSKPKTVKQICQFLEEFVHYDTKQKKMPLLGFNWGEMRFVGKVTGIQVQFVMFDKEGNPTRAKVALQIMGEDNYFMKKSGMQLATKPALTPSVVRSLASKSGVLNPRNFL